MSCHITNEIIKKILVDFLIIFIMLAIIDKKKSSLITLVMSNKYFMSQLSLDIMNEKYFVVNSIVI